MITNNWYKSFQMAFCSNSYSYTNNNNALTDVTGAICYPATTTNNTNLQYVCPYTAFANSLPKKANANGLHFGDGSTQPTKDDYYLSGNQITTLSKEGMTATFSSSDGTVTPTVSLTIRNTGGADVTIREIAWVYIASTGSGNKYCMGDRTVLDAPVTIPAGDVAIINYSLGVTLPTT